MTYGNQRPPTGGYTGNGQNLSRQGEQPASYEPGLSQNQTGQPAFSNLKKWMSQPASSASQQGQPYQPVSQPLPSGYPQSSAQYPPQSFPQPAFQPTPPSYPQTSPHFTPGPPAPATQYAQQGAGWNTPPARPAYPQYAGTGSGFTPPPQQSEKRPRRFSPVVVVGLVVLALLIAAGAVFGPDLVQRASVPPLGRTGAFVQPPLNADQVNDIQHLSSHMKARQLASLYVSRMTLEQEIGQITMVEYDTAAYSPDLDTMIHDQHAGGVIMYQSQINTLDQTKHDTAQMQQRADYPLFIAADEEGWNVHRLTNIYPPRKSAYDMGQAPDTTLATSEGQKVAHDLLSLGINTNLAPDVDVSSDKKDQYIGWDYRAFGDTPDAVIKYAGAYIKAMQSSGVVACIKHYPGIGAISRFTDPHAVLPTVNETKDQIYTTDLAPFKYFVQTKNKTEAPGMIMPTDVLMPAIDPKMPAEFSHIFITDILRKEFGYDGVILTDALDMGGVEVNGMHLTLTDAALLALNAGDDMLLGPIGSVQMASMVSGLKDALQNGTLAKSRLDEAATRVMALKIERHMMPALPPQ